MRLLSACRKYNLSVLLFCTTCCAHWSLRTGLLVYLSAAIVAMLALESTSSLTPACLPTSKRWWSSPVNESHNPVNESHNPVNESHNPVNESHNYVVYIKAEALFLAIFRASSRGEEVGVLGFPIKKKGGVHDLFVFFSAGK
jgi:hypothetical protein